MAEVEAHIKSLHADLHIIFDTSDLVKQRDVLLNIIRDFEEKNRSNNFNYQIEKLDEVLNLVESLILVADKT